MLVFFFRLFVVVILLLMGNRWFRLSNVYLDRLEERLDQGVARLTDRFHLWAPFARNGLYGVVVLLLVNHFARLDLPVVTALGEWVWDTFLNHDLDSVGEIALTVVQAILVVLVLVGMNRYGGLHIGLLNRVDRWLDALGEFVSFRMGNVQSVVGKGAALVVVAVVVNHWAGFNLPLLNQVESFARSAFANSSASHSVEVSVRRFQSECKEDRDQIGNRVVALHNRGAALEMEGNDVEAQEVYKKADQLQTTLPTCD